MQRNDWRLKVRHLLVATLCAALVVTVVLQKKRLNEAIANTRALEKELESLRPIGYDEVGRQVRRWLQDTRSVDIQHVKFDQSKDSYLVSFSWIENGQTRNSTILLEGVGHGEYVGELFESPFAGMHESSAGVRVLPRQVVVQSGGIGGSLSAGNTHH